MYRSVQCDIPIDTKATLEASVLARNIKQKVTGVAILHI